MKAEKNNRIRSENIEIRLLQKAERIPYNLLLDADPSRELVDKYLPDSEIYIVNVNKRIIGTYVLYPINTKTVEIKNIAVSDDFQGRGIGKMMLLHAIQTATNKGYNDIVIGTSNASIGQLYLYQKAGFEMTTIKIDFFTENYAEPIFENGLPVRHMIVLARHLK